MTYSCVGWEVGYTGDRSLRCGQVPGQDHVCEKCETKAVYEDVSLT
jgi:hypothetical protein